MEGKRRKEGAVELLPFEGGASWLRRDWFLFISSQKILKLVSDDYPALV